METHISSIVNAYRRACVCMWCSSCMYARVPTCTHMYKPYKHNNAHVAVTIKFVHAAAAIEQLPPAFDRWKR